MLRNVCQLSTLHDDVDGIFSHPTRGWIGFPLIDTHYHYHTHKHVKQSNSLQRTESDNVDFLMRLAIEQRRYA